MEGLALAVAVGAIVLLVLAVVGAGCALLGLKWSMEAQDQRIASLEDTRRANARSDAMEQLAGRTRPRRPV